MKTATELLAEMLALHADPQKGAAELYLWLHHRKGEVKEAVERGDDSEGVEQGLRELLDDYDLGGMVYDVRENLVVTADFEGSTWDHPKVVRFGEIVATFRAAIDRARGGGGVGDRRDRD